MARRKIMEQQQQLIEGYREGHNRKSIWYRIISVLSAITVFCTTYAMILPALTQEDPTVGVKMAREFYYENDDVTIVFSVTGRAVFKDEYVDIENPQAELVELEVIELGEGDIIYEEYAEHLEEGVGAEDLAQMLSIELKFSYLGNELDTSRCDITAEIQAKETFFTDEIGAAPQVSEPEADHPMAEPSYKSEPAMALTAIQGNGTNVFDAPTVYTTDVHEISTLTVDVKGTSLTILTSSTENPVYNVQYYAKIPTIANTADSGGTKTIEVINTSEKRGVPKNGTEFSQAKGNLMYYYLKSEGNNRYSFVTVDKLTKIFNDVNNVEYAQAPSHLHVDKVLDSQAYKLVAIWKKNPGASASSTDINDWVEYTLPEAETDWYNYRFTNKSSATGDNKLFIADGDTIRLIYEPINSEVSQDLTMYDYDISDGQLRTTTTGTNKQEEYITKQSNTTPAYMYTNGPVTDTYFGTVYRGINSVVPASSNTATIRFAFGNDNTGTGLDGHVWNSLNLNKINSSKKGVFELASGISDKDGDYIPTFASNIIMPNLFENFNDHNREKFKASKSQNIFNALVAYYDGSNNSGSLANSAVDNTTFNTVHNKASTTWTNLMGSGSHKNIEVVSNENNYFTDDAYKISKGNVELPSSITNVLKTADFTLEIEFGDIRDTGSETILLSDNSTNENFRLSIENGKLCFYKNGTNVLANTTVASKNDGYDLVSYSTITITQSNYTGAKDTGHGAEGGADCKGLRIYCNGACIYKNDSDFTTFNISNNLVIGAFDSTEPRRHTTEYRSIRVHSIGLGASNVKRNARYNASASLNLYRIAASSISQDISGKKVIGGRDIVFNRVGDTYTLSAINNTMGGDASLGDITDLEYFKSHTYEGNTVISNDFWPMDKSGTFGGDGHDLKFGSYEYRVNRNYFNASSGVSGVLPVSIDQQDHNSYFGFKHKFDFYVDPDYCGPLEFFFYGDDDVWVFLEKADGTTQLVCDLGGVHNPIGEYVDLRDYLGEGKAAQGNHSLYIFYLERGGSQSTAYMRMTVPTETSADVVKVSTKLEISNTVKNIDKPQSFNYTIELLDEAGNTLHGIYPYQKIFTDSGDVFEEGTIDFEARGTNSMDVSLYHMSKIVFYNLPAGTQYKITQANRHGFYTTYTLDDNEVIKGNVDRYGNVTDEDTVLGGVLRDSRVLEVDFYNTNYAELPSTGFNGENSVFMYYVPFGIATVYMCAMPFINRTKKPKKGDELEQA